MRSVTANTRRADVARFSASPPRSRSASMVEEFPLEAANAALRRLKEDEVEGAAVLRVRR